MWNAQLYGAYKKERSQPSVDLVNRIKDNNFKRILDAGCGSGMSTAALAAAFKNAEINGADLSENMLEAARRTLPELDFVQRDCGKPLYDMGKFDLIFSNAFMQWLTNQEEFINNSFEMLNENECERFLDRVLDNIKKAYAAQSDGNVLFPFKRLFVIAVK